MRIALGTLGRYHTFDLARQLESRDLLAEVFSGYPWFKLKHDEIPADKVHCRPAFQLMSILHLQTKKPNPTLQQTLEWRAIQEIDRYIERRLKPCDVYIALASVGLHSGRRAQEMGAWYICDRPCTHIREQDEILRKAFDAAKVPWLGIDHRVIQKEEAEYEQADRILVPSTFSMSTFLKRGIPQEKLVLAPFGVDFGKFSPEERPDPEGFDVLFVGAASIRKGTPLLLEAFDKVQHPRKRLILIGPMLNEVRPFVEAAADKGNVEVMGIQPKAILRKVMSTSHVFVLPSVEDGFGLVMAEAMACGCPVVASDHTGAKDLFEAGKQGHIFPTGDADALTQILQNLADHPVEREALAATALSHIQAVGNWSQYAERALTGVRSLVGPPRGLRILFLGAHSGTAKHRIEAMRRLGHEVTCVDASSFVPGPGLTTKVHWETGGLICEKVVSDAVLEEVGSGQFDVCWVDHGRYVGPRLLEALRCRVKKFVSYNGDNPFVKRDRFSWLLSLRALPYFNLVAVPRQVNVKQALAHGAVQVERVNFCWDEVAHHRTAPFQWQEDLASDVLFVGTAMEDRASFLAELQSLGVPVSIRGDRWDKQRNWKFVKDAWRGPGTTTDEEYAGLIRHSKVCLGLLSSGNRDFHTTRSMEIPALGGVLCAKRTPEHLTLYEDGVEAVFWDDAQECAEQCKKLLADEDLRNRIAEAGHQRALRNGDSNEVMISGLLAKAMGWSTEEADAARRAA